LRVECEKIHGGETTDELRSYGVQVIQPESGYRFSLDPLLLCDFAGAGPAGRIIDLGTGCGIIPLLMARKAAEARVVGVELQQEMAALACRNTALNALQDRVEIICDDVIMLRKHFPVSAFDLVVANPPYRTPRSGRISPRAGRDLARHESTAGIAEFLTIAKYLVKPAGRISFVYHPDRLAEFIHCAAGLKLCLLRLRMVHGRADAPARMFLAELAKGRRGAAEVLPPLVVYGPDGGYTPEMRGILGVDEMTEQSNE